MPKSGLSKAIEGEVRGTKWTEVDCKKRKKKKKRVEGRRKEIKTRKKR